MRSKAIALLFLLLLFPALAGPGTRIGTASAQGTSAEPVFMVHYMPWFQAPPVASTWGWHWTMNYFNPNLVNAEGQREIASHYYPEIGPYDSRDPDVLEYHTLLMKVAGIDGVIVAWYGTSDFRDYPLINDATERLFDAVQSAGLEFAICYEDQTVGHLIDGGRLSTSQAVAQGRTDIHYVHDRWMTSEAYLTLDDRPVLLNFGPQYFESPDQWTQIFAGLSAEPQFFPQDSRLAPVAAGAFPWPPMWYGVNGTLSASRLRQYLDSFYANGGSWPHLIGGAWPGFHDIYEEANLHESFGFLDARDGLTFEETLQRAQEADAPVIQIVTWNDFGEGTNIEPADPYGYRYLTHVQETVAQRGDFPFQASDLELPVQLFRARKERAGEQEVQARLDAAAAHIVAGRPGEARSIVLALAGAEQPPAFTESAIAAVFPNPTGGSGTIQVRLSSRSDVRLEVVDALGRTIDTLLVGSYGPGTETVTVDSSVFAPGVYFVRLMVNGEVVDRVNLVVSARP